MTTAVQLRRGTTAEHATFTGLEGETTVDTTKTTLVVHNGSTAGGFPIAREDLANVSPTNLPTITGDATAADDKFLIYDQSALALKQITRAELNNAIEQDALANVSITGGTINGTTIGGTTAAGGSFTTLNSSGATTLNGTTIPASKTLVDTDTAQTLTNKTLSTGTAITAGTINNTSIGATTASTGAFTTLTTSSTVTHNGGTANGVAYLNGSKVLTTGSALTFDGSSLGIGVSPTQRLTIGGQADAQMTIRSNTTTGSSEIYFGDSDAVFRGLIAYAHSDDAMKFSTSAAEAMRITSAGNVGIGTSSPQDALDITAASGTASIRIASQGVGSLTWRLASQLVGVANAGFVIRDETNTVNRLVIDGSGNVGIGTSSPSTKLTVHAGADGDVGFFRGGSTRQVQIGTSSTAGYINTDNGSAGLEIRTQGTARMFVDNSGNLGLGVTPSVWEPGYQVLENSAGSLFGGSTATLRIIQGGYINSGYKYKYNSVAASLYEIDAGAHKWYTAPSGTAGNAISFTQAMTLDASGNLGVGTTDPDLTDWSSASRGIHISNGTWAGLKLTGSTGKLHIQSGSEANYIYGYNAVPLIFGTNNAERARIDSSGNLIQTVNTTAATLATNGTLTFSIVDNSTLRISVRGSDGTTRTATVALT